LGGLGYLFGAISPRGDGTGSACGLTNGLIEIYGHLLENSGVINTNSD